MASNVLIVNLQQVYQETRHVLLPYVYGALRSYVEQFADLRQEYRFLEPLCVIEPVERMLDAIEAAPDVVGFSTYVWNHESSHFLARSLKQRFPRCLVVVGGPHVPNDPSDYFARHPWVDICVHGEGEQAFAAILRERLRAAPDWAGVAGISFQKGGVQQFTSPGQRLTSLDLPSPFVAGHFDGLLERWRSRGLGVAACLETNRGCPYSCSFCDWGMATSSKLRAYPEPRIRQELEWMADHRIVLTFLNDANFGILPRDPGLMEYVVQLKRERGFPREFVVLGYAKNNKDRAFEINRLIQENHMDASGNVNFSLQATNQPTLDAIQRQNIPLDNYRALSDRYAQSNYMLVPDLIFPLPGETLDSFKQGYADLASWSHVRMLRVYQCAILPNAPMAKPEYRERWGLKTRRTRLVPPGLTPSCEEAPPETIEMVVSTRTVSPEDVAEARVFMAVVNAFEVYRLTRDVRRFATRRLGVSPRAFYERWMEWQRGEERVLSGLLREILRDAGENSEYCEELAWSGQGMVVGGVVLRPHKAIIYSVLTAPEVFLADLRQFLTEALGLPETPLEEEMLRYQRDQWLLPDYDGREACLQYEHDWPAWLQDEQAELERRPVVVRYPVRAELAGYRPSFENWLRFALAPLHPATYCCQDLRRQQVERVGESRSATAPAAGRTAPAPPPR